MKGSKRPTHITVELTRAEVDVIRAMAEIADAGPASEGDYQTWTLRTYKTLDALIDKLMASATPHTAKPNP